MSDNYFKALCVYIRALGHVKRFVFVEGKLLNVPIAQTNKMNGKKKAIKLVCKKKEENVCVFHTLNHFPFVFLKDFSCDFLCHISALACSNGVYKHTSIVKNVNSLGPIQWQAIIHSVQVKHDGR